MYLGYNKENTDNVFCIDIETESLTPNIIWCAVIKNLKTEEVWKFRSDGTDSIYKDLKEFIDEKPTSIFIGHNIVSFDGPVLARLCLFSWPFDRTIDTLCLSYLYNPALDGGHSLAAYGERLGLPKIEFDDWTKFSEEQLVYCERDVDLTIKVFWALQARMKQIGFSELSCEIEHKIRHIIDQQQETGFYIDKVRAENLYNHLRGRESDLSEVIHKLFPPELKEVGKYTFRVKKDGSNFASYERHRDSYTLKHHDDGTYSIYELEPFNIGSPKQRVARLLSLGWEPTSFTPKGFPKVDEDSLVAFSKKSGEPAIQAMADWLVCNGRANMVGTWLGYIGPDSRIHGRVLSCGATTRRMTHFNPNCVPLYSQALTRNGWKFYNELTVGEDILAYDLETRTKKWTPLLAVSSFPAAEIYSFGQKNPRKRLFCTKNHSWVVRDRDCKGYKNTEKLVEAQKLKYNRPVKINAPFENDVKESDFSLIQEKYGYDWVSEICKLSNPELNAMMQGFLLADGCRHMQTQWQFAQAEGPLLDAFLTCLYLVSDTRTSACQKTKLKGPNQRMGYNVVQTKNTWMRTKDMALRYEGVEPVWCPTTKFGTWVMKQGDFITITGNTANIPSGAKAKYGHECRELWTVEPDQDLCLVGADASGLENVGLLHYLNNKEATEILNKPKPDDIHSMNSRALTKALGRDIDREWGSKTAYYAWLYGGYPKKLGEIVKGPPSDGEIVVETFFKNVPGLKALIDSVQSEWKRNKGLLKTIDGGYVRCPSINAALNYKIQSLGAIVMKLASIILHDEAARIGLWFLQLGTIHDEWQMACKTKDADTLGKLAVWAMEEAASQLKFRVPLTGAYKIGSSWAETH